MSKNSQTTRTVETVALNVRDGVQTQHETTQARSLQDVKKAMTTSTETLDASSALRSLFCDRNKQGLSQGCSMLVHTCSWRQATVWSIPTWLWIATEALGHPGCCPQDASHRGMASRLLRPERLQPHCQDSCWQGSAPQAPASHP